MIPRIWEAVSVTTYLVSSRFLFLLGNVVMRLAQRLPVTLIPEQALISVMLDDVVNDHGFSDAPVPLAHGAQWVALKVSRARLLPPPPIELAVGNPWPSF
jgi:hypothetical protein